MSDVSDLCTLYIYTRRPILMQISHCCKIFLQHSKYGGKTREWAQVFATILVRHL